MDVFAFSSRSETQGLVVTEAMAAGLPVVALRASGVREVVQPGVNGLLLPAEASPAEFARALGRLAAGRRLLSAFRRAAIATAAEFSRERCAQRALSFYADIQRATRRKRMIASQNMWVVLQERLGIEWNLLSRNARALSTALAS
jgi:glycosyltransferase involved in cell wall biosynthesis